MRRAQLKYKSFDRLSVTKYENMNNGINEHHTKKNVWQRNEIRFGIFITYQCFSIEADFICFLLFFNILFAMP